MAVAATVYLFLQIVIDETFSVPKSLLDCRLQFIVSTMNMKKARSSNGYSLYLNN